MSLANSAQDKKFVAVEGTSVDKKFVANSFSTGNEANTKTFGGTRNFFSRVFGTNKFARAEAAANAKTQRRNCLRQQPVHDPRKLSCPTII